MVDDRGRGMSPDRLREVARNLFESTKAGDDRTLGEKAIGLLGFQQLGGPLRDRVPGRPEATRPGHWCSSGAGPRPRSYVSGGGRAPSPAPPSIWPSSIRRCCACSRQRKVVEYLRRRRGPALARGDYSIEVVEGRTAELVSPEEPEGVRLAIPARATLWGRIEFALYVAADASAVAPRGRRRPGRHRASSIDITELEELDHEPWSSGQVSGQVVFEALQQTAGRRAVLRDGEAFPVFREAVLSVEPLVVRTVERLRREVDQQTADRVSDTVRRIFERVLKELADLENPMRAPVGEEPGSGALPLGGGEGDGGPAGPRPSAPVGDCGNDSVPAETPDIDDLTPDAQPRSLAGAGAGRRARRPAGLVTCRRCSPIPRRARLAAASTPTQGVVLYSEHHADFLMVKDDEAALLDYLATLVAKEYVVYNNPLASAEELGEEMVRMLVRVRRHLPRRR